LVRPNVFAMFSSLVFWQSLAVECFRYWGGVYPLSARSQNRFVTKRTIVLRIGLWKLVSSLGTGYDVAAMSIPGHETLWKRFRPFFPALFLWAALVAIASTATAPGGVELTWALGLKRSLLLWTIWVLLAPLIVTVDRRLPVSRDALFKRFVFHIPLSLVFTLIEQL